MLIRFLPMAVLLFFASLTALAVPVASQFVADGFTRPVFVCSPPGDTTRLLVVELGGKVKLIKNGTVETTPFLDISSKVNQGRDERGLLGLAFHPNYSTNGYFYVNYIGDETYPGDTFIERYQVSGNPDAANANSGSVLLTVGQPDTNHNGGWLGFGPNDGYLYVALGDGGGANDPSGNGQNIDTKLGKILRLDVDIAAPYAPSTNPFYGATAGDDLIWAYGLRNPFRCSFDRANGNLWIGDVGQDAREEIDLLPATAGGGKNFGWKTAEGFACRGGGGSCGTNTGFTPPVLDYPRTVGQAVVGGYVYRGSAIAGLQGTYFYADYIYAGIWSFTHNGSVQSHVERSGELNPPGSRTIGNISSFGEDANGELYLIDYNDGELYKIVGVEPVTDTDGDGLIDSQEAALGTNPNDSDSDDDGLSDGAEVNTHGTDPKDSDSDNDGLSDGAEVNTHKTDPKKSDTDGDGLSDNAEINTHGTDPKKSDTDTDGLSDGAEINTHTTNPKDSDSDDDGLSDGVEVNTLGTNPKDSDSDDDGLSDGAEVNTHGTSPFAQDSDGDTLSDGAEVNEHGTNPTGADTIAIGRPEDGETWTRGRKANIQWSSQGAVGDLVRIELWQNGLFVRKIKKWTENDGKLKWRVSNDVELGGGYNVYIRSTVVPAIDDVGNATFSVTDAKSDK